MTYHHIVDNAVIFVPCSCAVSHIFLCAHIRFDTEKTNRLDRSKMKTKKCLQAVDNLKGKGKCKGKGNYFR
jgi:hypothetical protein